MPYLEIHYFPNLESWRWLKNFQIIILHTKMNRNCIEFYHLGFSGNNEEIKKKQYSWKISAVLCVFRYKFLPE